MPTQEHAPQSPLRGADPGVEPNAGRPGATLPRMTADPADADDRASDATATFEIDMAYLYQRELERMADRGEPLPAGLTVGDLAEWRRDHPDYDPELPLCGMPGSEDARVSVGDGVPLRPADGDYDGLPVLGVDVLRPPAETAGTDLAVVSGDDVEVFAEVVDPDARCLAATGAPAVDDVDRRCKVNQDGSHRCYQGPGHQGAKSPGPVILTRCEHTVPEWATHTCDCGLVWANVIQVPA